MHIAKSVLMPFKLSAFMAFVVLLTMGSNLVKAQTATMIIQKMDANLRGNTSIAETEMHIIRPSWKRSIQMKAWSKGTDFSLIYISFPARDKGISYLKRNNEIWNWIPSISRTIKLPPSMMMQSWMGSDFKNDDLVRESSIVKDYNHSFLNDSTIRGMDCYQIELMPKENAPVIWRKVHVWVSKDAYIQLKTIFYDEDDEIVSTMVSSEIKEFDGRMIASVVEIMPSDKPGNKTILKYLDLKFDVELSENFFSLQNMKRVK